MTLTMSASNIPENAELNGRSPILTLHIRSGEIIGIIGGNRLFKIKSLIQLIPRLYDATEGTVKVGGVDVKRLRPRRRCANQVAVVLQKNELFSGTIKENLRWGNTRRNG